MLGTIKTTAEAVVAYCNFLATPAGQRFADQIAEDRASWDKFWAGAGEGIKGLFDGTVFKRATSKTTPEVSNAPR